MKAQRFHAPICHDTNSVAYQILPSHSCVGLKKSLKIDVLKGVKNRLATITIVQDRSDPPRAVWKISSHIAHSSARRAF